MGYNTFPGGVHPHDFKSLAKGAAIAKAPLPPVVRVYLSQHIGAPAKPLVAVGDTVLTGQKIAEPGGFVSIPMHAPLSGTVSKIEKFPHPAGGSSLAIEITSDNQDKWVDLADDPNFINADVADLKKRVTEAGISGMGGAGFPAAVKLSPPPDKPIDTVILNGVECEPFLTADYRLMLEKCDEILAGLQVLMKITGAKQGVVGIEANKPDAIKIFSQKTAGMANIRTVGLKLKYPQGAEKQLIYAATGRKVPNKGGLPMQVGVVVQNVGTAYAVYEACRFGKPLIERIITVSGPCVAKPQNLLARVGTPYAFLVEQCDGFNGTPARIISGGPMMGFALPDLEACMGKGSSGLLLLDDKLAAATAETTCIRCAACVDACPMSLAPTFIASAVRYEDWDLAEKAGVMDCMKCGSCAFVCPAHVKFIQWIDLGKNKVGEIMKQRNK